MPRDMPLPRRTRTAVELRNALDEAENWSSEVLKEGRRDFVVMDPDDAMRELARHPLAVAWTAEVKKLESNLKCVGDSFSPAAFWARKALR